MRLFQDSKGILKKGGVQHLLGIASREYSRQSAELPPQIASLSHLLFPVAITLVSKTVEKRQSQNREPFLYGYHGYMGESAFYYLLSIKFIAIKVSAI